MSDDSNAIVPTIPDSIESEVERQITKLAFFRTEVLKKEQQLKDLKLLRKFQLEEVMVAIKNRILSLHVGEGKKWLQTLYWTDAEISTSITKAHTEVFGGKFFPTIKEMEVRCRKCKTEARVPCKSWTDYKTKYSNGYICNNCEQQNIQQQLLRNLEWEKQKQDRLQEVQRLCEMPYNEYLMTEHWQEFRKYALKRAGYRCQLCNSTGTLDVHHRTYERRGCEEIGDVTVLCRKCHEKHHDIGDRIK